jgi:hypothetical protein
MMRTRHPKYFLLVYLDNRYSLEGPVYTDEDWNDAIDQARLQGNRCHLYISNDPLVRIDSEKTIKEFVSVTYRATEVPSGTLLRCGDQRPHEEACKTYWNKKKQEKKARKKRETEELLAKVAAHDHEIDRTPPRNASDRPYYIIIQDFDKSAFSVEGPMIDDEDWTTAVIEAQKLGRRVSLQIYGNDRFDYRACVEEAKKSCFVSKQFNSGSIVRTPSVGLDTRNCNNPNER